MRDQGPVSGGPSFSPPATATVSSTPTHDSKLLQPLLGRPILLRTLEAARRRGDAARSRSSLGYQADRVRALVERGAPAGLSLSFAFNPDWQLENGVSALAARPLAGGERFALLMGDHVFEPPVLAAHAAAAGRPDDSAARGRRACRRRPRTGRRSDQGAPRRLAHRGHRQGPASTTTRSTPACSSARRCCSTRWKRAARTGTRRSAAASASSRRAG